ncbi:hypothetical protein [Streptomyces sp. NPDC047014]|uniref:hypothetical protein n=1 Tax=Streptomyces sp. NPDC047014 TaxID=3155736 RepID=UPI0034033AEE
MKWPWGAVSRSDRKAAAGARAEADAGPAFDEEPIERTVQRRLEESRRAAEAAEREGHRRMVDRWGSDVLGWRDWLARSPVGVDLLQWWHAESELTALVGEERYVERLGELLSQASARDVAAMGLGCTRRVDRACRFAETCSQDPVLPPGGKLASYRHGGVAGACSSFSDCYSKQQIDVTFADGDRHRSVLLYRDHPAEARLWVDGVRVGEGKWLDKGGFWEAERFFFIRIEGPENHPEQGPGEIGTYLYNIVSLLIHDAERGTSRILVPEDTESWTDPMLAVRDGMAYVYPTREDRAAEGTPDRVFPVEGAETG